MKNRIIILILVPCSILLGQVDTLWTKTFGGSADDFGHSVQQTTDGGYIIIGWTESFGAGGQDVWLIKTDASGDTLWTKAFGGSADDAGYSIQQTIDNGYIIVGYTESFGAGAYDFWLIKADVFGNIIWTKTFGGSGYDGGLSVQQTFDGGYIITGATESFGSGGQDLWLIKTDTFGDTLWTKTFGGIANDFGYSIQQTIDSSYIIVGYTELFAGVWDDVWLIKTNSSGDSLWTKTFGGPFYYVGLSVQQTTDTGYIIAGYKTFGGPADVGLIKTDSVGDTIWTKTFGGSDTDDGNSIQQTTDNGYIITGYTKSFGAGSFDVLLIKTTSNVSNIKPNGNLEVSDFSLKQNYPNPFNPSTKISWQVPVGSWQTLRIYDVLGNEVATLIDEYKTAGSYEVEWDASVFASGVYFYQLQAVDPESSSGQAYIETKKMILLK